MSKMGWRWWDLAKDGSLQSVNRVLWPPNEALKAEHEFGHAAGIHQKFIRMRGGGIQMIPKHQQLNYSEGQHTLDGVVEVESAPAFDCHCGYWAYWDPMGASGLPRVGSFYQGATKVFGVVEAWGEIVTHELGFRAEWCIPRAVCVLRGRLHPAYEMPRYTTIEEVIEKWDSDQDETIGPWTP